MPDRSEAVGGDWTLVTVTHNSATTLRRCWTDARIGGATWLVVDNASTDRSADVARELGAYVVESATNRGFAVGNNVGLDLVTTPWVAFVNPDVTIGTAHDLVRLAATSAANDALVAPQLTNADQSDQLNARGLPFPTAKLANRGLRFPWVDASEYARAGFTAPTYIAWAMGAAYAGPTRLLRELGGWDDRYFVYYEDHDLGLRAWGAGHTVVLEPSVRWKHEWVRATSRLRLAPWRHELRSARIFYSVYPELRLRRRGHDSPTWSRLRASLWSNAVDSGASS